MGRLATIKTLAGFDFTFQPSLDRDRIFTLAQLGFIDRHEAVHFLGLPGTGKSHLATALGVEAVKAGKSVYFTTLADLIGSLARSEPEGRIKERIRFFAGQACSLSTRSDICRSSRVAAIYSSSSSMPDMNEVR
ncbi:IstB domain protein ATP-binding protein [Rhizobium sp. CF080]|nr:IstB domain protein ATP-binding protein [Rhizobium sp. CF080]